MAQAGVDPQAAAAVSQGASAVSQAAQAASQNNAAAGAGQPGPAAASPGAAPNPADPNSGAGAPAPASRRGPVQATPEELERYSNNLGASSSPSSDAGEPTLTNRIEYYFTCAGDDATSWRVRHYSHVEGVSELYEVVLELWTELDAGDPQAMLGTRAELLITRDESVRKVQGVVWRYEESQGTQRARVIRVWIVPAHFGLTQRIDSRIFQDLDVVDITREVITTGPLGQECQVEYRVNRTCAPREYCVQYCESDYDFVSRLLQSEGLFFWFEPTDDGREMMIVGDRSSAAEAIESANEGELIVRSVGSAAQHDEVIDNFRRRTGMEISETVAGEFDWLVPARRQLQTSTDSDAVAPVRQAYRPKPSATVRTVGSQGVRDLTEQARLLQEEESAKKVRCVGGSNAIGLMPGRMMTVVQNAEAALDGDYVLIRVEHEGTGIGPAEDGVSGGGDGQVDYVNRFWAVPKDVPYRVPRLTPKPRNQGPMTATVVGPDGAEIYTDEHGRIKVQFHWDRLGHDDERSSCFMRVSQPWAGPDWGVLFIPRIGMECIVSFLYGDLDQPLITGTVYNAANPPPFGMPDDATRSGWKTRSSPNGEGYNELSFEDKKGSEEVRLQAEKDFNELVKHNHSTVVKNDQSNSVSCQQTVSVGGDRSVSVKKNETYTIDLDRTTHVKGNDTNTVDLDRTTTIVGTDTETIQKKATGTYNLGRERTVNGDKDILTVNGQDKETTVHGKYLNTVDTQFKVAQGANTQLNLEDKILAATTGRAQLKSQAADLDLNNNKAILNASNEISLTCGASSIVLKSDGTITISGAMKVEIGSGASSAKLEPAGVNVSGPKISSAAIGIHEVTGAVVKIN
jgi:type VI secretion system secreted protein VgrG